MKSTNSTRALIRRASGFMAYFIRLDHPRRFYDVPPMGRAEKLGVEKIVIVRGRRFRNMVRNRCKPKSSIPNGHWIWKRAPSTDISGEVKRRLLAEGCRSMGVAGHDQEEASV